MLSILRLDHFWEAGFPEVVVADQVDECLPSRWRYAELLPNEDGNKRQAVIASMREGTSAEVPCAT